MLFFSVLCCDPHLVFSFLFCFLFWVFGFCFCFFPFLHVLIFSSVLSFSCVVFHFLRMFSSTTPQSDHQQSCPRAQSHTQSTTTHERTGALVFSSSCLNETITRVGPGQNPQCTRTWSAREAVGTSQSKSHRAPQAQPTSPRQRPTRDESLAFFIFSCVDFFSFFVFVCVDFFISCFSFFSVENFSHHDTRHPTAPSHPTTQPNSPPHNTEPLNRPTTQPRNTTQHQFPHQHPNTRPITPTEGKRQR